jgi:hypothetical protein
LRSGHVRHSITYRPASSISSAAEPERAVAVTVARAVGATARSGSARNPVAAGRGVRPDQHAGTAFFA